MFIENILSNNRSNSVNSHIQGIEKQIQSNHEGIYHHNDVDSSTRLIFMDTRTYRDDPFIRSIGKSSSHFVITLTIFIIWYLS